jgi:asparagine synthase (glutamine-hydrolysing)
MSMLNSLEVRVPYLDHRIVEFGVNLPRRFKNDGTLGKIILRKLGMRLLPEGHIERPKVGFAIPRDQWMREEMKDLVLDCLQSSEVARDGWLVQSEITRIVDLHMRGRQLGTAVWTLLVLELWYRSLSRVRKSTSQITESV